MNELFVCCSKENDTDGTSFSLRSDNLATIHSFISAFSLPSKFGSALSSRFLISLSQVRAMSIVSTDTMEIFPQNRFTIKSESRVLASGGGYIALGGSDGVLRLWRAVDGELVVEAQLHIGSISSIVVKTSIWVIFVGTETGVIAGFSIPGLFRSKDPEKVWTIHTLCVTDLAISTCGTRVFSSSSDHTLKCFDFAFGCEIFAVAFETPLKCVALANNESIVYVGGLNGKIYRVLISQDLPIQCEFVGHKEAITNLILNFDDRTLYSASVDKTVKKWDTATGQILNSVEFRSVPFGMFWGSNDKPQKNFPALKHSMTGKNNVLVFGEKTPDQELSTEELIEMVMLDDGNGNIETVFEVKNLSTSIGTTDFAAEKGKALFKNE